MTRCAALAVATLWLLGSGLALAEEGVFVAKLTGGTATVADDAPHVGGAVAATIDYGWTDRIGLAARSGLVVHRARTTLGGGLGLQVLPVAGPWTRLYLFAGPQALLEWPGDGSGPALLPAVHAGLGLEYLIFWGFGVALEATGTLPIRTGGDTLGVASASALAGLFMEL